MSLFVPFNRPYAISGNRQIHVAHTICVIKLVMTDGGCPIPINKAFNVLVSKRLHLTPFIDGPFVVCAILIVVRAGILAVLKGAKSMHGMLLHLFFSHNFDKIKIITIFTDSRRVRHNIINFYCFWTKTGASPKQTIVTVVAPNPKY
jgi:hypothetical protein